MNRPARNRAEPPPGDVRQQTVEISLMAVYLALAVGSPEGLEPDPGLEQALDAALERRGLNGGGMRLLSAAMSGMPQAILPFRRERRDILLAAGLVRDVSRAGFRGDGHGVDAGYFVCMGESLHYVDTVERVHHYSAELVELEATRSLVASLRAWREPPTVEVGDPAQGELLRLRAQTELRSLRQEPPAQPRLARQPVRSNLSLLRVAKPAARLRPHAEAPAVTCVASGVVLFERDDHSLLLREAPPELLMEMHAAGLAAQEDGAGLWLHLQREDHAFLAPLPDLMQPGARSSGWWAPLRDITSALGGSLLTTVALPRGVAMRLMRHRPWAWMAERDEWVRCAWWQQHSPPSSMKRLGSFLGLSR